MNEGQLDSPQRTYRVVGVCHDKSHMTVEEGLLRERAEDLQQLLLEAGAFRVVEIEPELSTDSPRPPETR